MERNKAKIPITKLLINNQIVEEKDNIRIKLKMFYQKLFTSEKIELQPNYLKPDDFPKIAEHEKQMLDEPLSVAEIEIAIKQLKAGKCPGMDGLGMEIYDKCLPVIKYSPLLIFKMHRTRVFFTNLPRRGLFPYWKKWAKIN